MFTVRYSSNGNGWWRFDIVNDSGETVKGSIVEAGIPTSPYAAEAAANAICARMNREAQAFAAMVTSSRVEVQT